MGKRAIDLTGQIKGDWTVVQRVNPPEGAKVKNRPWYLLECKRKHQRIVKGQEFSLGSYTKCHECMAIDREEKAKAKRETTPTKEQVLAAVIDENRQAKIGEESLSNDGTMMKIVEYYGARNVIIEFQDEHKCRLRVEYGNFKKGNVKNPYHKLLYGRGYIGIGEYQQSINRKATREYDMWRRMFDRCYSGKYPAYNDCEVCKEWWNFQNFAKWYTEHYYEIPGQVMQIDKDWLCIGNRLYCPEHCCIAPHLINACLLTHPKVNNAELPNGISYTASHRFKARCSLEGKRKDLGTYDTVSEAWEAYKNCKIKYVESLSTRFKDYIPKDLYDAVNNYGVTFKQRSKYTNETICELS